MLKFSGFAELPRFTCRECQGGRSGVLYGAMCCRGEDVAVWKGAGCVEGVRVGMKGVLGAWERDGKDAWRAVRLWTEGGRDNKKG